MNWRQTMMAGPGHWTVNPARQTDSGIYGPSAPLWEQAVLSLWFYVTFINEPGDELILYPIAAFWTAATFLRRATTVPLAFKCWPIVLLPAVALLSFSWADNSTGALRFGMMMCLTTMIIIYVASRFAVHEIIRSLFLAGLATVVLLTPELVPWQGSPWGEKNIFAQRMAIIMLAAMAVGYNKYEPIWLRLPAVAIVPVTFVLVVLAESATALVFAAASLVVMTGVWLFWSPLARFRHLRSIVLGLIGLLGFAAVLLIVNLPNNTMYEDFLAMLGKDTTLTGRTMLWDAADRVARERPLLGVGAGGFWLWEHGTANTLLEMFYKDPGTKFSFHNSYLEIRVHFGLVGLVALIIGITWSLYRSVLAWLQAQNIVRSFCLLISAILVIVSFTESIFYSVLDVTVILFQLSAVTAVVRREALSKQERMLQSPDAYSAEGADLFDPVYGLPGAR